MPEYLKKINRSSVVQRVIDRLTQAMLSGELKPGDKIPTEMELSEQLGVARNSIRECRQSAAYPASARRGRISPHTPPRGQSCHPPSIPPIRSIEDVPQYLTIWNC